MQTTEASYLDVTVLEPRQKHPTIFRYFDDLEEGESLVIHNDHDPKPLYYQLLGERGNIFSWEYLEQGPLVWEVKISKNISGEAGETLGEIATKDLRKAEIFKKYGLDFCCGGKKTLKQACAEKGLDAAAIEQELAQTNISANLRPLPYNDWSIDFLADYIQNMHHGYVRKTLPEIRSYAAKVAAVHQQEHPELIQIAELVEEIHEELSAHMVKEEKVLFPYVKELVKAKANTQPLYAAQFGTVQNPINMMEMEHEMVGKNLEQIRLLSKNYALPADACASYKLLFSLLNEFESDLFIHIHLENNILFPKALQLEKQLKQ